MRDILTRLTNTDEIDVVGKGHEIDASLKCADLDGLSIMHVTYGDVPTRVNTYEHDEDTLLLFILTGGAAGVRHGGAIPMSRSAAFSPASWSATTPL